ncbi:MAG: aminotransferase class I/II-fold pyridoxal phosphate-dependent enzyme [Faecalibacterium prausnitzii]
MVFLCQLNNPTRQLTPLALAEALLHRCEACGALLVVDECFLDFLPESEALCAKKLLASPNLIILKAFTKLYGMAGVRLGYCLGSNIALLDKIACRAAGRFPALHRRRLAALDETACEPGADYLSRSSVLLCGTAAHSGAAGAGWQRELSAVPGTGTIGRRLAAARHQPAQLRQLPWLDGSWYRTAVRTAPENQQLIEALRRCLHEPGKMYHGAGHDERCGQKLLCTALCRIFAQDGYR